MYFILMTYFTGSTLGKKLFRIKVIASDTRKLSLWTVIFRETIGRYLSKIIIYIGYIMMLPDKEKRPFVRYSRYIFRCSSCGLCENDYVKAFI